MKYRKNRMRGVRVASVVRPTRGRQQSVMPVQPQQLWNMNQQNALRSAQSRVVATCRFGSMRVRRLSVQRRGQPVWCECTSRVGGQCRARTQVSRTMSRSERPVPRHRI